MELRYCLGDGLLRSKTIKNSNLSRDEKVTFHFDPLPNRLCFLADCMFPGRPICIDVLDAGHQDYLGTIQRSHDNIAHCMSQISSILEDSSNRPGSLGPLVSSSTFELMKCVTKIVSKETFKIVPMCLFMNILIMSLNCNKSDDIFNSSCWTCRIWNVVRSCSFHPSIENKTSKKI